MPDRYRILSNSPRQPLKIVNNTSIPSPPPVLLTRDDVAQRLSTTDRHVRRLIEDGRLPSVRLGGKVRIHQRQLDAFVARLCRQNAADDEAQSRPLAATADRQHPPTGPVAPRPVKDN